MFQNSGRATTRSDSDLLYAVVTNAAPSGMNGSSDMTACCICPMIGFRVASSGASNQASRSSSRRGAVGQPKWAAWPLPRRATFTAGSACSNHEKVV